jgi:MFS family permease
VSDRRVRRRLAAAANAFVSNGRSRELRRAQLGFAGAWTAEWAFTVALGVYAFRHGGATAVGVVSLLRMLPSALIAPFATPYADRWRRELVLLVVSGVRGIATAATAFLVSTGGPPAGVYALAIVSTVAATLYRPAHSALLPSLCRTPAELASANVVRGMLDSLATLVGPIIAALLLDVSGVTAVFLTASAASFWSAGLMIALRPQGQGTGYVRSGHGAWGDVKEGVRAVRNSPGLRLLLGLAMAQTFTRGALAVFTVVLAIDVLGTGESGVGTLTAAVGAGAVTGSIAASMLVGTRRLAGWFGLGVALWGLPMVGMAGVPYEWPILLLLAIVGVGNALVDVGLFTLMSRLAADAVLARVFGLLESIVALTVGVGSLVTPLAIHLFGVRGALAVVGAVCPVLVAATWSGLRKLDTSMVAQDAEINLLQETPMLRPLSLPAIEQLARGLEPVVVPAGGAVFDQGDPGDRFFVIGDGMAEVVGDGRVITTLGPGEAFGEIALLRRIPRTATVRAVTDLRLQALDGDRFLSVVTGFPASIREGSAHADTLLRRFSPDGTGQEP